MLLCISHSLGCRYYLGDFKDEKYLPEFHAMMNWIADDENPTGFAPDNKTLTYFAPESLETEDGRRVMWAWLITDEPNIPNKSIMSLPRELSLNEDGTLGISPLRELESQRYDERSYKNVEVKMEPRVNGGDSSFKITDLGGDAYEIKAVISRKEAKNKRMGFHLFAGEEKSGFPVIVNPVTKAIRVGPTSP